MISKIFATIKNLLSTSWWIVTDELTNYSTDKERMKIDNDSNFNTSSHFVQVSKISGYLKLSKNFELACEMGSRYNDTRCNSGNVI